MNSLTDLPALAKYCWLDEEKEKIEEAIFEKLVSSYPEIISWSNHSGLKNSSNVELASKFPELFNNSLYSDDKNAAFRIRVENPRLFDPESINWGDSFEVTSIIKKSPEYFDPSKFDWKTKSHWIVKLNPILFDSSLFNWEEASWAILEYAQSLFDSDKFNWERDSLDVIKKAPSLLDVDRFNWKIPKLEILEAILSSDGHFFITADSRFRYECNKRRIL